MPYDCKRGLDSLSDHAAIIEESLSGDKAAQNAVIASWQRSKFLHGLEPDARRITERLSEKELRESRERMGSFLHTAKKSLDRLYQAVGNTGCCALLADSKGVSVARRGAVQDDELFNEWGLWSGTIWSEGYEGTNGIGTCIVEERTLNIHKNQHYHSKNAALSCTAAPIFDHEGKLIAAIDVSSCRADLTRQFGNLISLAVVDTARRIETEHFRNHFSGSQILFATPQNECGSALTDRQGTALLAVDRDGLVIGATRRARRFYRLNETDFENPFPVSNLFGNIVDYSQEYITAENRIIQQSIASSGGNISKAARSLGVSRSTLHRKLKRLKAAINFQPA